MMSKDMESTKKHLFQICMKGKWDEVVEIYKEDKRAHTARITKSGDTALHVAVTDGKEEVVSQLVKLLVEEHTKEEALRMENERRNTALHFAASMGTVRMIEDIGKADPSLVSVRNVDGETPLVLAALHGRKDAFMILHHISLDLSREAGTPVDIYANCRRTDGDTILHCAIDADNFDLAFQIIHLYGDLVNSVNESGATPLHLLANKPSAFRSGSRLGRFETFLYYGILVKELKEEPNSCQQLDNTKGKENKYPTNYQTCVDLMRVTKNAAVLVTDKVPLLHRLVEKCAQKDQTRVKKEDPEAAENTAPNGVKTNSSGSEAKAWAHPLFPPNYKFCADFIKFVFVIMLVIFGRGTTILKKIQRKKEKHVWSVQIMNELLERASMYEYDDDGSIPQQVVQLREKAAQGQETYYYFEGEIIDTSDSNTKEQQPSIPEGEAHQQDKGDKNKESQTGMKMVETPILIAAKNGITEMVDKILELFPVAAHDMDAHKKNIVLLAIENRQPHLYEFLLKRKVLKESLFRKVDNEANSALHLAAKLAGHKPWLIPGEALQMHWEIKWYYFVKESMPSHFFRHYNKHNKTPGEIFTETHKDLVQKGGEWLKQTSESCSLVAALVATVAFAASTTVPGGVNEDTGIPTLEATPAFKVFAISSLIALCFSVTAVVLFLSILTSRYQAYDFGNSLTRKLILGLTSLFMSITSMLVSFCAGHFLVLRNKFKYAALPIYAVTCLPVTLFAFAQFPLYFDLIWATFKKVPQRSFKATRV